ncbi:prolipoprotein diacylglyceryl transferase [Candidatus Mycoplasma pogonae]
MAITTPEYAFKKGESTWIINNVINVYGVMIFLGFVASILTIVYFWKRKKIKMDYLYTFILITIPSSIIGARLWFIFEQLLVDGSNIHQTWWKIWEGGLSIQGGVFTPTVLNLLYAYRIRKQMDYRDAFSYILPAVLIGQAIGRWGNFSNHEVYGGIIDGEQLSGYPEWFRNNMYIFDNHGTGFRVPLFFYESLSSLFGYLVIVWVFNFFGWLKPGVTGGMYIFYYGVVRASMENLREEAYDFYFVQSILFIILGLVLMIYFQFFSDFVFTIERYGKITTWAFPQFKAEEGKEPKKPLIKFTFSKFKIKFSKKTRYSLKKQPFFKFFIYNWERMNYNIVDSSQS